MDSRHDHRSLGAVVAGTACWASQHYRSRINHGFQKLPTYIYPRCLCMFMPVCGQSLRTPCCSSATLALLHREKKAAAWGRKGGRGLERGLGGREEGPVDPVGPSERASKRSMGKRCNNLQLVRPLPFIRLINLGTLMDYCFFNPPYLSTSLRPEFAHLRSIDWWLIFSRLNGNVARNPGPKVLPPYFRPVSGHSLFLPRVIYDGDM